MGCGGSKSDTGADGNNNVKKTRKNQSADATENEKKKKNQDPELQEEPQIQDVDVPSTEPGYPALKPPRDKKSNIFDLVKMKDIDKHARQTPKEKGNSYQELISHLSSVCSTDLEKLRAIFVWLGNQDVKKGDYSDASDSDTPRGFLKLMQKSRAAHSSFFPLLCRHAGLPCVIVRGYAKAVCYEVGDEEDKVKFMRNSWNLVYVSGGWRIVFPLWACQARSGHKSGFYTKVETKGQAVREKEDASEGETIMQLNEFYFLTDPEKFIFKACPEEPKHQLLAKPWSFQKFCEVPLCSQSYFSKKVEITSEFSCRLKTIDGTCNVELTCEQPAGMYMDYELYYNHKESGKDISPTLQLKHFVFLNRTETKWNFGIRFPEVGIYKLEINGGHGFDYELCSFKIFCDDVKEDCKPLPVNPGSIGFGPNLDTELAGVKAISHHNGLVKVTAHRQNEFKFTLSRSVNIKTTLVHSTISEEELQQYVKLVQKNRNVNVVVSVPDKGEYALRVHTQEQGQAEFKNVCNYLLTSEEDKKKRKRNYENPIEKNTRSQLQNSSKTKSTKDIEELEKAIEKFEKMDLEDKGDLEKAHNALEYKKLKRDLDDAIKRRHLETLEKAIEHGQKSRFSNKVQTEIRDAEELRDHLRLLNRIAHDVLEMKQTTIAELYSYKAPQPIIFDVMHTTFIMLGENPSHIEEWEDLTILMRKTGKLSMLRRVRQFDTVNVQPEALYYTNKVITDYNETEVCLASAGAGTFYRWLKNVSTAIESQEKTTS